MLEQILEKIRSKGWNLYEWNEQNKHNLATVVGPGPVSALEEGKGYYLFPQIEDPVSPSLMHETMMGKSISSPEIYHHRDYPGQKLLLGILYLRGGNVLLRDPRYWIEDFHIKYATFLDNLDSLPFASRSN